MRDGQFLPWFRRYLGFGQGRLLGSGFLIFSLRDLGSSSLAHTSPYPISIRMYKALHRITRSDLTMASSDHEQNSLMISTRKMGFPRLELFHMKAPAQEAQGANLEYLRKPLL